MEVKTPKSTQEFKEFIISFLRRGGLTEKRIEEFTDEKSMRQFRTAFTHKTYGSKDNYELAEFLGDTVGNSCIAFYLKKRFPELNNRGSFITRLKQKYISKSELFLIAKREGFLKHILYGHVMENIVRSQNPDKHKDYRSMLEDTFEAFIGTVVIVIDGKTRYGVGNPIACNIISSFISDINISLDYEVVFDAKSILKMVYDTLGWEIKDELEKSRRGQQMKAIIYGYPSLINDSTVSFKNYKKPLKYQLGKWREVMAIGYGADEKKAADKAAEDVLERLDKDFNIQPKKRDISKDKPEMPQLDVTPDFRDLVVRFLKLGRINENKIGLFTGKTSMEKFRYSLIHKSYGGEEMAGLSKFLGDVIIDNCIAFYLKKRFPAVVSVWYLTNLKHNVTQNDWLGLCIKDTGIFQYIKYKSNHENIQDSKEYTGFLKDAFSSLIGTMVTIIDDKTIDGAGYLTAYNIVSHYLNKISITLEFETVFSPKTRLKEIYDNLGWKFNKEIDTVQSENIGDKIWKSVIYGYPYGKQKPNMSDRVEIGVGSAITKKDAEEKASLNGIEFLRRRGIAEVRPDPFKKN